MEVIYREIGLLHKLKNNPRKITPEDMERLKESIRNNPDYLEAHPIVLSDRTGELVIIDGNQRYEACCQMGYDKVPTALLSGLTEEREKEIIIRANVNNGQWDIDKLLAWDAGKLFEWGLNDISFDNNPIEVEEQNKYTRKIEPPVYEPQKEDAPPVENLYDKSKYDSLVEKINLSNVPEEVKEFLRKAATRHIVFDYGEIAEYYAHASKEIQKLMEESALVIIDIDSAIENGYARLRDDIYEIMLEDTDDEE